MTRLSLLQPLIVIMLRDASLYLHKTSVQSTLLDISSERRCPIIEQNNNCLQIVNTLSDDCHFWHVTPPRTTKIPGYPLCWDTDSDSV